VGFNSQLMLMRPKVGRDAAGQPLKGHDDVEPVWADVRAKNGHAAGSADARTPMVELPIRIRRRADVASGWAMRDGAAVYEILAVLPDNQDRINMVLACRLRP
jgi:SPP1 family predicted phage head-tail adaptor